MPPHKELPGFYFDAHKNRYFPLTKKGPPIPRSSSSPSSSQGQASSSQIPLITKTKRIKLTQLLSLRETQGRPHLSFNSAPPFYFHHYYQQIQASHPSVWKFDGTKNVHTAIQTISIQLQTPTGTRDALFLATTRSHGLISFFQVDNPEGPHLDVQSAWSPPWHKETSSSARCTPPFLSLSRNLSFPSDISCVKLRCGLNGQALYPSMRFNIFPRLHYQKDD
ncbi:DDB1-and CUL4-associated factor 4 [Rhynchospora pubera]|uniref:DDB1-and CUL4-associated factor 4 n=1 Tax=Rhynchospora pubera TaxID=906938 RepID=A0AAV8FTC9_9POAL|nr:DDB1-and CUL4-associated factor 4 [Rhynchospora pubera]